MTTLACAAGWYQRVYRTRNSSMMSESSSIPNPGPCGTGTRPSTSGGRFLTSFRINGEGRRGTKQPDGKAYVRDHHQGTCQHPSPPPMPNSSAIPQHSLEPLTG